MRNLSRIYCLNESQILREGILSKAVDCAHQPILWNFWLERRFTRGIISLGHYIKVTRFLGPIVYKRGAPSLFSTCLKVQGVGYFASGIPNSGVNLQYRDKRRIEGFKYFTRCKDNLFDTCLASAWSVFGIYWHMVRVWI